MKNLSIYSRMMIVIALTVAIILLLFLISYYIKNEQEKIIVKASQEQFDHEVNSLLLLKGEILKQVAYDYTYWDELVNAIKTNDTTWFNENITTILTSFRFDYVCVTDKDFNIIHESSNNGISGKGIVTEEAYIKLQNNPLTSFFVSVSDGVFEVSGASVHPTNDPSHTATKASGYLFVAKQWNQEFITNLAHISGAEAKIVDRQDSLLNKGKYYLTAIKNLAGINNETISRVVFSREYHAMKLHHEMSKTILIIIIVSFLFALVLLRSIIRKFITTPLKLVSNILESENIESVNLLQHGPGEFRRIGSLFKKYIQQKYDLELAKQNIVESEVKYRTMFANNPQPMWIYDLQTLKFLEVNDAAVHHYGYSREEFLSMTLKDIRPEEDVEALLENIKQSEKTYDPGGEWRHLKKNGEIMLVEIVSHSLEYNARKARHIMVNDITKRKQAENELQKLSQAVEQSPVSIIITDLTGNIEYTNPKFSEITGYTSTEVKGRKPNILKSGKTSAAEYKLLWETISSGNTWRGEFSNMKKNGEHFFESASISPIKDSKGKITHYLAVKEDITKRKIVEEQISRLNENLEQKIQERTFQLQLANKEMKAFSYSVSHDLRSPLRAIAGFASILVEDYDKTLDVEGKRLLNLIAENAKKMGQLIDDLLAFSRLGSKDMNVDKIDMSDLIQKVYDEIVTEHERALINFDIQTLPVVYGDYSMLKQVWINLTSNAIKFTSQKTERTIKIGCFSEPKRFVFYIKDNGAGFDMTYSVKLFGVFQRLHSTKEFEGTGIGLALVKQIINRHKGQIWAESSPNQGATFFFSLPNIQD